MERSTYDGVGNKKTVEETNGRRVEYAYDELYRLESEKIVDPIEGDRTIKYTYDSVGNRLTRSDSVVGLTTYVYDDNDRLLTETASDETVTYTYDSNGNLVLADTQNSDEQMVYTWDGENRLTDVTFTSDTGENRHINYQYDALGLRVSSIGNGGEMRYLFDINRPYAEVVEEYAPDGEIQTSYVHGLELISQHRENGSLFHLYDEHSGVRQLGNELGTVTDTYSYDAYGNLLNSSGSSENNYLYRGEQFDPNIGLYYLRERYYEPELGRFPTTDPFEGMQEESMSRHRYLYGYNNPVTYADPSGAVTSVAELGSVWTIQDTLAVISYSVGATALSYLTSRPLADWEGLMIEATGSVGFPNPWLPTWPGGFKSFQLESGLTQAVMLVIPINTVLGGLAFGASASEIPVKVRAKILRDIPSSADLSGFYAQGRFVVSSPSWLSSWEGIRGRKIFALGWGFGWETGRPRTIGRTIFSAGIWTGLSLPIPYPSLPPVE